jgi:hypothetical protein
MIAAFFTLTSNFSLKPSKMFAYIISATIEYISNQVNIKILN